MATIYRWKCDICGQEFGEDDAGFKTRSSLYVKIPTLPGDHSEEYGFDDTCLNCRTELSIAIEKKLSELKII